MKKILLGIILVGTILLNTGCTVGYEVVDYSAIEEKLNNKETFVLVIGSNTCSGCAEYKPDMDEVGKNNDVKILYIDQNEISDSDLTKLSSKFVITATPTTIFIEDGVETNTYDRIIGAVDSQELEDKIKQLGLME